MTYPKGHCPSSGIATCGHPDALAALAGRPCTTCSHERATQAQLDHRRARRLAQIAHAHTGSAASV